MREGPLADLFRSTEESVDEEDVRVTATRDEGGAHVEVAVHEHTEIEVTRVETEPEDAPNVIEAQAAEKVAEPEPKSKPEKREHLTDEIMLEPAKDPAVEEIDKQERAYREIHETHEHEVEHEGLERLMGGAKVTKEEPAWGRNAPDTEHSALVPRTHQAVLRVVGVGGAGVNAVNRMVEAEVPGVEFVAINTDLQSLQNSNADHSLHIGAELTRGLGSGSDPRVGYRAAFDEQDKIKELLKGSDMVFIAAGSGGGTGTGAAPVVAKLARDIGALTVGAVTKPFAFEGARRAAQAEEGIAALGAEVDTLIVIPNERLLQILERRTSITDAFRVADDVLRQAVQGISDLVMLPGLINLDFADVRTTMLDSGDAILGIGMGVGEHRAQLAAEKAVASPLLDTNVEGAQSLLLSITGGTDLSLVEASEAANIVQEAAHPDANIIFGASIDEDMHEEVWVTVIATRFDNAFAHRHHRDRASRSLEPQSRERDDYRTRAERDGPDRDQGRYADPVGDWRSGDTHREWGRGTDRELDRPPTMPGQRPGSAGRVNDLDVPEFTPGH
jgi:cell division protein FtsZ